jgi:hypothetical protein
MAYSKITIEFISVPTVDNVFNFKESKLSLNLNEIFKNSRLSSGQVEIPGLTKKRWEMTYSQIAATGNIGVNYTPFQGIYETNHLRSLETMDNLDDTYTVILQSFTPPNIVNLISGHYIAWPEGSFSETGDVYSEFISDNYKNAFDLDYNSSNLFTVISENGGSGSGLGTVVITANYPNAVFVLGKSTADVVVTIENQAFIPDFNITNAVFSSASSNQCQNIKVNATTSTLATKIVSPFVLNGNANNPLSFDWIRGRTINLIVENAAGTQASQSITLPAALNVLNFSLQINNSRNGGTAVVENTSSDGLVLQYSLDNSAWQTSNVFNGLEAKDYMLYVKDQYGCSFTKPFSVDEFGIQSPYFYISKSNSFRFANRISWGDSANYKTDENTLSCEADVRLAYQEIQQFQTADVITTQFKSNYKTNSAKIVKSDLSEVDVPVIKMTNNIGIKDKRDAVKYNIGGGKTGVYFLSGNKYDYNTNVVTEAYYLNGLLPEWGQIGNYIQIGTAWFLIDEIAYDEGRNAEVIVIASIYTGADTNVVVGSIFNRFNYEVYEFTIDMVNYINQKFRVRINNTDSHFTEIIYLSELIWCKVKHDNVLEIKYSNSTNTDMFYSTGITNLIRIPYLFVKGKVDEENETHKTDTTTVLLNSDLYEVDEFVFEPVTKEIWRKIMQALSHENVTINGIGYVKNGNFNTEGPLEDSNLYVLTATMIKTGSVYNSKTSGNLDFNSSSVEVPGLIATESGFISY